MNRDVDFVVAMTESRVIGNQNQLPWKLPQDLKRFKQITTGHTVIMGRKTFESIGRPLPHRKNVVLTRDRNYRAEGIEVCHDWESALATSDGTPFVIGGGEIFQQALPRLRRLYLTVIFEKFSGDAYFPEIPLERDFVLEERSERFSDPFAFEFQTWRAR